jgi:phosphohistidine swiveling domain-containing protein
MHKGIDWVKLITRPQTGLTLDFVVRAIGTELPKLVGVGLDIKCELKGHEGIGIVFEGIESRKKLNVVLERRQEEDSNYFHEHIVEGRQRVSSLIKISGDIKSAKLGVKDERLKYYWENYRDAFSQYIPFLHTVFAPEAILTKELKNEIKNYFPHISEERIEQYFRILTTVEQESDFYLEQKDLFEIAIDKQTGKDIEERLAKHAERFGYMGLTNSYLSESYDKKHFQALIKSTQDPKEQLNRLVQGREKELSQYREFIEKLPAELLGTAKTLQLYMIFRTERIVALKQGQDNIKPLLREIGKRKGISFEEIIWYKVSEIEKLFKGGGRVNISKRRQYFVIELVDGEAYYSEEPPKTEKHEEITELKGMVAHPGVAKGRVRLVLTKESVQKFREGEILVTTMTTPDLIAAIKQAGAIVTDEGGILSHAAIVSREFGIACVIGTGVATKVLKDGDLVEVDAEKGLVKVLKKAL